MSEILNLFFEHLKLRNNLAFPTTCIGDAPTGMKG
jgi:hypothetical protein